MNRKRKLKNKRKGGGSGPSGSFKGKILVSVRPRWQKSGRLTKPRSGAELTTRQVLHGLNFAVKTGFNGGTNFLQQVNTGGFAFAIAHSLQDLPQRTQFTSLFDQYRFEEIELHFLPFTSENTTTNTATNIAQASQFVLDFDDSVLLADENAATEYSSCQTAMNYDAIVVRFKPAVSPAYYSSGAFTGYGTEPSDKAWLDCASTNIIHYGVKGWVGGLVATSTMVAGWQVYGQYTISFRNTR